METNNIKNLLLKVKNNEIDIDDALESLKDLPYEDLGYAKIDHHRSLRNGYPEVIYCEGKSLDHIEGIVKLMLKRGNNILGTRASKEVYLRVKKVCDKVIYYESARIISIIQKQVKKSKNKIVIVSAGTADISVAEEAAITAEMLGNSVDRVYDVGVAGIHRLLHKMPQIREASVVICVAGMEGALASVVGGLVSTPVIAVPTSIGYGASFGGISALLTMLNSCASGVGVVNIDNGFGAAYLASTIIRQIDHN